MLARLTSSGKGGGAVGGTHVAIEASFVLALAGQLAALIRRDTAKGGVPPPAPYRLVLCEGERCVPLGALAERSLPAAEAALARYAARYRAAGAIGRLVLLDRSAAGTVVAARRVWP